MEHQRAELQKEKNSFEKQQSQRELGWKEEQKKKLDELEAAQKQLQLVSGHKSKERCLQSINIILKLLQVREEMELAYRAQCMKLAEDWQRLERIQNESKSMLLTKESEIRRQTEELLAERGNTNELVSTCNFFLYRFILLPMCLQFELDFRLLFKFTLHTKHVLLDIFYCFKFAYFILSFFCFYILTKR